jgi:CubicO group peptidase (beta-lactamase class C family)
MTETDPIALRWMVGSPPPPDRLIRYEDGSYYRFPQWRWSFSHWRQFRPTVGVSRGSGPISQLPRAERADLDAVEFVPMGAAAPMTWADSLAANYTDGIVVLHRGNIVYERYFGALAEDRPHICFSVTKSVAGTLAAMLIAEGALDAHTKVARYLPQLASSGFGDATVAEVMDMTTAIGFDENYEGKSATMAVYRKATGFDARRDSDRGPTSVYAFLPTIPKLGAHGDAFTYRTPNVDVAGWLIARVTGKSMAELISERLWGRMGAEEDACLTVDGIGVPLDIRRGASREAFAKAGYATLPGWSYHHYWWVSHDDHGVFMARGIHGQALYVDPRAEMVIARFASHPLAGNVHLDPTSLPAYRAMAEHLAGVYTSTR